MADKVVSMQSNSDGSFDFGSSLTMARESLGRRMFMFSLQSAPQRSTPAAVGRAVTAKLQ